VRPLEFVILAKAGIQIKFVEFGSPIRSGMTILGQSDDTSAFLVGSAIGKRIFTHVVKNDSSIAYHTMFG